MLGSAADAEDVVQETWLRWAGPRAAAREDVRDPRAYLVRIVTRQALNRLRTLARRREEYVGEWLPEPLLTSPDVAEDVELAESVSIAMLTVLETLGPPSARSSCCARCSTCPTPRSLQRSTRRRPRPGRSPTGPGSTWPRGAPDTGRLGRAAAVVERFLAALQTGDVQGLLDVLAPDVVVVADGGGVVAAVRRPIEGAEAVARLLAKFAQVAPRARVDTVWLNGAPAARIDLAGQLDTAVTFVVEDGRIARIYAIRNPHKLARLDEEATLSR
jgi:RNA polymerase sigma-70 factor (ECF subfamily)